VALCRWGVDDEGDPRREDGVRDHVHRVEALILRPPAQAHGRDAQPLGHLRHRLTSVLSFPPVRHRRLSEWRRVATLGATPITELATGVVSNGAVSPDILQFPHEFSPSGTW
jgi:hypothetical protein